MPIINLSDVEEQVPLPIPEVKELLGIGGINLGEAKEDALTAAPQAERLSGIKWQVFNWQ